MRSSIGPNPKKACSIGIGQRLRNFHFRIGQGSDSWFYTLRSDRTVECSESDRSRCQDKLARTSFERVRFGQVQLFGRYRAISRLGKPGDSVPIHQQSHACGLPPDPITKCIGSHSNPTEINSIARYNSYFNLPTRYDQTSNHECGYEPINRPCSEPTPCNNARKPSGPVS